MLLDLVLSAVGLLVLTRSADQFVLGAARVSLVLRVSALVVGAVVVGFGTSAPEMLVSALAAVQGDAEVGVGNVVGSNVANLTLILGIAAFMVPLGIEGSILRRETPMMVVSMLAFALVVRDGVSPLEAAALLLLLGAIVWSIVRSGVTRPDPELEREVAEYADRAHLPRLRIEVVRTAGGLIGTVLGAQLLVVGAVGLAEDLGLSGGFVGFTLVAVGTSLPELVTAVAAARAGEAELVVGNLLGSNIFNSLAVGATLVLAGTGVLDAPRLMGVGLVVMVAAGIGAWLLMLRRRRLARWEGALLLGSYAASVALVGPTG